MRIKYTLNGCVDCIAFVANGTLAEERPGLLSEITEHLGAEDTKHLVSGPEGEWFDWARCECCNRPEGGMRGHMAVLRCETAKEIAQTNRRKREKRS